MLQAGASLCILLAAAFTASIPLFPTAAVVAAARCSFGEAGPSAGVVFADGAVTPVSYTHLDVYKRQLPNTPINLSTLS